MATASTGDVVKEMIKCPICFETYLKPKYLPCLHTLCETCLSQYITSAFKPSSSNTNVNKPKAFPCPICRVDVPVLDPFSSPEDIASALPVNHLIVTLIDQQRVESKDKQCDPCLVLDEQNTAISWCTVCNEALCTNCDKCHRAMKMTQHHKICGLKDITTAVKPVTILASCPQHGEERVNLFCMDHEEPCCAICVIVRHHKCEHVKTLTDAAKGIHKSLEIRQLSASLKPMINELNMILESRRSNLQLLAKEKQHFHEEITKKRQDINKHLDQLEETVNKELDGRYKESSILIVNDIAEIESNLKILSNYQNRIDSGLKNVSDIHTFLEINKIRQQHRECSELLKKRLEKMRNYKIEAQFEDNWADLTKLGTVKVMASSVDFKSDFFELKTKKYLQNCTATKIRSFSLRTGGYLSDGIFLPNNLMLLVNQSGRKLIFCTLQGQVQKELSLSGFPWGVVQISDKEAAIVLYYTPTIQYIDIVNCTLGKHITVNIDLYGAIGYNDGKFIVGGTDSNIYLIDGTGKNIEKVASENTFTEHITCTADNIFLTTDSKLVCLDMNGSHIFRYSNSNFRDGLGISVDGEGNIYCCSSSTNSVHQLTPDGQFIKLLVTDITSPSGIAFDMSGERFLVTRSNNSVTLYELKR